jgi:hypothetical protein
MADRKPLVLINGQIAQLPAGDVLVGTVSEVDVTEMQAKVALSAGHVVYCSASFQVLKAVNDDAAKCEVMGLAKADTALDAYVKVQGEGFFELADWTSIAGSASLTAGQEYWLDATAGQITSTPPTSGNLVLVGRAVKPTVLQLKIGAPIAL